MTDVQILQLFGITLFPLGLSWIINPRALKETIKDIAKSRGMLLLSGLWALIMGYLILALHHSSAIVVVVIGWLALLKGLAIIILPSIGIEITAAIPALRRYFLVIPWLVLVVGVLTLYLGYFA